jgi:hypothetical protein
MYLTPVIHITINDIRFYGCKSFTVEKNIDNLSATGSFELPLKATYKGSSRKMAIAVDDLIKTGYEIKIEAGYREDVVNEVFAGYVTNVDTSTSVKVTVEDSVFLMRKTPVVINEKDINVADLAKLFVADITGLSVSENTINAKVDAFKFKGNAAGALAKLKDTMKLSCYFDGNELYIGGQQLNPKDTINVIYGINILKNNVKYQYAETNPVQVTVIGKKESGEELKIVKGMQGGSAMTFYKYNVTDEALLEQTAIEELNRYSFDGLKGTLKLFFIPFAQPGGAINYRNDNYKQDNTGTYFIKGVKYTFTTNEALKQVLTLGARL